MVYDLVVFSIISFLIESLVPKDEYRKYIRMFVGIGLISIVVMAIINITNSKADIMKYFNMQIQEIQIKDDMKGLKAYEQQYDKELLSQYKESIKEQIRKIVEEEQLVLLEIEIILEMNENSSDFLAMKQLDMKVSPKYENESIRIEQIVLERNKQTESVAEIAIKNRISKVYNLDISNINISK